MRFIAVWLFGVFVVVLLLGSCLYAAEGGQNLMDSIPVAMWRLGEEKFIPIIKVYSFIKGYWVLWVL